MYRLDQALEICWYRVFQGTDGLGTTLNVAESRELSVEEFVRLADGYINLEPVASRRRSGRINIMRAEPIRNSLGSRRRWLRERFNLLACQHLC